MGKKSRRPPRQQKKLTLADLDDDTAKPTEPKGYQELFADDFMTKNPGKLDPRKPAESEATLKTWWRALSEGDRQKYRKTADGLQKAFELTVGFCAKSGPDLVGQLFQDCLHSVDSETGDIPLIQQLRAITERPKMRVVGLAEGVWEASLRDKDVRAYYVEDDETGHRGRKSLRELKANASSISLRELRARACGDASAARKAARRSYEFVSRDGFDESTGTLFRNGRFISHEDLDRLSYAANAVGLRSTAPGLEYNRLVVINRMHSEGLYSALKAIKKWPRVRPYWKRVRRRICHACNKQVDLSEPRFLVCSGCGDARYCSEQCQRDDWYSCVHQEKCTAGRPG